MGFVNCEILGVQNVVNDLKNYDKKAGDAVEKAVSQTAIAVESDAKKRLKGFAGSTKHWITGLLASSIYKRKVQTGEHIVGTNAKYAPYIEFGTGDLVFTNFDFDDNAKVVAAQYKGAGKKKVNIKGDSFMNWAAVNQEKKLIERIEKNFNDIK